jgi:ribonuclease P protein component
VARLEIGGTEPEVGFAVPRSVGTAVTRNRLRRRLRAALAESRLPGGAYLVIVQPAAASLDGPALRALAFDLVADVCADLLGSDPA